MGRAEAGDAGKLWVTATEQLTGKARRGRSWVSKPGNLYSSLLLIDPADGEKLSTLPLVVSVALAKTVLRLVPKLSDGLAIKWPNDLLIRDKKVSGILLEASRLEAGSTAVVIGCGINCQHFPENPLYPATSLHAEGCQVSVDELFFAYAQEMASALDVWDRGNGFAKTRKTWLEFAKGVGEPITARFPSHDVSGIFKELDGDGQLILEQADGTEHRIAAADIFFGESHI